MISKVSLKDLYAESGSYTALFSLDKERLNDVVSVDTVVFDSCGAPLKFQASRWGSRLKVIFEIDSSTADGVCSIRFNILMKDVEKKESFLFWTVK